LVVLFGISKFESNYWKRKNVNENCARRTEDDTWAGNILQRLR
jgi:hypothetical protein